MNFMNELDYVKFLKDGSYRIKMISNNELLLKHVRSHLSVKNHKKEYMKFADETLCPISLLYSFYEGLTFDIIRKILEISPKCKIDLSQVKDIINPLNRKLLTEDLIQPENQTFKYRFYQENALLSAMKYGRGVVDHATGAGKSLVQYGIVLNTWEQIGYKGQVLMIVPTTQLVCQMYGDFIEYGCDPSSISMFSSQNKKTKTFQNTDIIITNRDWLLSQFGYRTQTDEDGNAYKMKNDKSFEPPFNLANIKVLLVDECHGLSERKSVLSTFISKIPTKMKFGFSGSIPKKEKDKTFMEYCAVIGTLGSVIHVMKAKELQVLKTLAKLNIAAIQFAHTATQPEAPYHINIPIMNSDNTQRVDEYGQPLYKVKELDKLERAKLRYPLEWEYIEKCKMTNEYMAKFCLKLKGNAIVLYDHNIHGDMFMELLKKHNTENKQLFLIYGEVDVGVREDIRKSLERDSNCILVANTKCFSTGINIKNIRHIIFGFSSGAAAAKIIQSIGRGLRLMEGKVEMWLYDFYHNFRYSTDHFNRRELLYLDNYDLISEDIKRYTIPIDDRWLD